MYDLIGRDSDRCYRHLSEDLLIQKERWRLRMLCLLEGNVLVKCRWKEKRTS
jgi:hypothetical protein